MSLPDDPPVSLDPPDPPVPPPDPPEPLEPELLAEESGGWTALPSAVAFASVSAEVESVNRPPFVLTVIAPTSVAREVVFARLIAMAAATDTPPEEESDFGVLSPPSDAPDVPRVSFRLLFPKLRSPATWFVTPSPEFPPLEVLSPGAPAAEACASAELSDLPCAASVTAPVAARFRARVVSVRWFAIVRASATPTAAVVASFASPAALVMADAV